MEKPRDVGITLSYKDTNLVSQEEGYVGRLECGFAVLEVVAPDNFIAFHVDGKKNISLKKYEEYEGKKKFTMKIRIEPDTKGIPCTNYLHNNNMRLLEFEGGHMFTIWEIALISQNGDFFLTTQLTYHEGCFRSRDRVTCPYFEDTEHEWSQLVEILRTVFQPYIDELPTVQEYRPKAPLDLSSLEEDSGIVLFWNFAQNLGFIETRKGVAYVYWLEVPKRIRLRHLEKGEIVWCTTLVANPIYGEKLSAKGVYRK